MKRKKTPGKPKRKHWFVGDPKVRDAHDGSGPLTRGWREGEPLIRVKGWLKP